MTNHTLQRQLFQAGCIMAGTGVLLGAFGAHSLKDQITDYELSVFDTAVKYQLLHAIALILIAIFLRRLHERCAKTSGQLFLYGTILFSGSLYIVSAVGNLTGIETKWVGGITPIGGLSMIGGWFYLAIRGYKNFGSDMSKEGSSSSRGRKSSTNKQAIEDNEI